MNTHDYIASGIVESYVLGLADEDERKEFEQQCLLNPELVEVRNAFELMLEAQVLKGAIQPPKHILAELLPKIKQQPAFNNVIPFAASNVYRPTGNRRRIINYLAAASVVALLCCGYFLYRLQQQHSTLAQANSQLLLKYKQNDSVLNSLVNEQPMAGKGMAVVHLTGSTAPSQPTANIYWDSTSAAVYLVAANLPKLPSNKQYQLWAQIDGTPKSLGVFDAGNGKVILKMNNCKKADAFAITIQQKGGDTTPSNNVEIKGKAKQPQ